MTQKRRYAKKRQRRNGPKKVVGRVTGVTGRTGRHLHTAKDGDELAGEVLAYLRRFGYDLTAQDLGVYRRAGLIAVPRREALGRGNGSASWYPAGTAEIVLQAARIVGRRMTARHARAMLALDGYVPFPAGTSWPAHWRVVRV